LFSILSLSGPSSGSPDNGTDKDSIENKMPFILYVLEKQLTDILKRWIQTSQLLKKYGKKIRFFFKRADVGENTPNQHFCTTTNPNNPVVILRFAILTLERLSR
jgi:hypothetical protein